MRGMTISVLVPGLVPWAVRCHPTNDLALRYAPDGWEHSRHMTWLGARREARRCNRWTDRQYQRLGFRRSYFTVERARR